MSRRATMLPTTRIPDWLLVCAGFVALTLFVLRDLLGDFENSVIFGADAYLYLWNVWWVGQSLFQEHSSPYFSDWIFYPTGVSLLFHSFGLTAIAPWSWLSQIGPGTSGVVAAFNMVVITALSLTGLGVYLLAVQETGSRVGGVLAGIAFSFSAHRMSDLAWLDLLSAQFLIFFVLFMIRGLRGSNRSLPIAGLFAALTAYNSSTQALFGLFVTIAFLASQPRIFRATMPRVLPIAGVALVLSMPLLWEFFEALYIRELYWADRIIEHGIPSSLDPLGFFLPHHYPSMTGKMLELVAPDAARSLAADHAGFPNKSLGPLFIGSALGAVPLTLAAVGVVAQRHPARVRFWGVLALLGLVMSMGPYLYLNGEEYRNIPLPYILLREIPGFALSRAPYRFITLAHLAIAILAAFGVATLAQLARDRLTGTPRLRWLQAALVIAIVGEYCLAAPPAEVVTHSEFARGLADDPRDYSVLYYPLTSPIVGAEQQMWHQVVQGKRLLYGYVARVQKNLGDWARPYHHSNDRTRGQLAYLKRLIAKQELAIEYLVYIQSPGNRNAPHAAEVLKSLEARYPLVAVERDDGSNRFKRPETRSIFYVAGEHQDESSDQTHP